MNIYCTLHTEIWQHYPKELHILGLNITYCMQ